ncbi:dmX-like protein 2 isoform X5 [Dermacentor silvarum]|uniref:dmX-like protein 2 isoform X5 n=1 Tax=Dermacentor silvarum TaxID=543639 RepID=UPI002100B796|nr:dmX-like protein 2 isoform X5 [Dermacentor silvarum]
MNLHQVLTGAVNAGDHCYSVGSVEGVPFTVYGAGCNIVILARNFERVQIIPGVCHGNVQVSCINCSTDIGKIAAAYGKQVAIFEPSPLLQQTSAHKLDYKWIQTATIQMDYSVSVLSWNLEGTRLLTGGEWIQMWKCTMKAESNAKCADEAAKAGQPQPASHSGVSFQVGSDEAAPSLPDEDASWDCIWHCRTSQPVSFLRFSPDGTLFASAGKCDRLVKIWHNSQHKVSDPGGNARVSAQQVDRGCTFGFVYAAHPRAVTGLSWRKTSKFMPRGSVANMLVTSCRDNICRLWVQTLLPEDGLINVQQIEALANQTPRLQTQRHRQRILQKLRHMKSLSEYQRRQAAQSGKEARETIPSLPSTYSVHDFHSFGLQGSGVAPGLHFHLAASINAETDIPLVPSMSGAASGGGVQEPNFVLHWLNNKEMSFSSATEQLIQELSLKALQARREQQRQQLAAQRKAAEDAEAEENQEEANDPDDLEAAGATKSSWQGRSGLKSLRLGSVATTTALAEEALPGSQSAKAFSPASSSASLATEASGKNVEQSLGNALDHKIESLLREWHQSPDLLFSIHPVDGSFLVWLVDWLDECSPGSFRQALVSFSSRIPTAIPLGDAATLSHHLALYLPTAGLDLRTVLSGLGAWAQPSPLTPVAPVALVVPPQPVQQQGSGKSGSMQQGSAQQGPVYQAEENEDAEDKPRPFCCQAAPTPSVCMLSKHHNGSLNLWHLTFSEESHFTHVLSIGHAARVSGHRFRINDITCHPVLPLLLTTSHHNLPKGKEPLDEEDEQPLPQDYLDKRRRDSAPTAAPTEGFCSELILWKVESVGPLSKSGGVAELARINSLEPSAFSNVAWVPTLLPSTTLGSISNSPSACFVASDGLQLRVYQAVIDARTLLAEVLAAACRKDNADTISLSSTTSSGMDMHHAGLQEEFRIVSLQSTARPGCIVELDAIADATNDWQNTQLLHVFQEQLIMGAKQGALGGSTSAPGDETLEKNVGLLETSFQAFVDLRHTAVFEEPFYLVVLEKTGTGRTMLHMWRLVISSRAGGGGKGQHDGAAFPENVPHHDDDAASNASSRSGSPEPTDTGQSGQPAGSPHASPLRITTSKVCTQELPLPHDVEIVHSAPAAGHVSSSNIYPACFAPYVLSTACSDGLTRFWKCKVDCEGDGTPNFTWVEWEMTLNKSSSVIQVPGQPISVSCAYSGRVACAYKRGHSFNRPGSSNPSDRCVNLGVAIYECESTGGSEWILEDTVLLNNVSLPRLDQTAPGVDLGSLVDTTLRHRKTADSLVQRLASDGDLSGPPSSLQRLLSVPSYATLHTLRRAVIEQGNQGPLVHKSLIQLDWVSSEDGSHVLTVAVGSRILLFAPVAKDVIQQGGTGLETQSLSSGTPRPLLKQVSSLAAPVASTGAAEAVRWLQIRCTRLETADGLPPLPMQVSWVRDGILVVGMDSEMHIYSQWRPQKGAPKGLKNNLMPLAIEEENICKVRMLPEEELLSRVQELSQLRLGPGAPLGLARNASSSSAQAMDKKKQRGEAAVSSVSRGTAAAKESETTVVGPMPDLGLFETCRLAWPMLPQYHPKQLMELLGFGKIRRVKAILSHLVRCVSKSGQAPGGVVAGGNAAEMASEGAAEEEGGDEGVRGWSRSRTLSLAAPAAGSAAHSPREGGNIVPEELQLDYVEIQSIPPLPLYALLAADKQLAPGAAGGRKDASPSGTGADAGQAGAKGNQADYSALFETLPKKEETLDDILQEDAQPKPKKTRERHKSATDKDPNYFGMRQARLLTQLLTHCHLPGLSSVDQMHLLALADTLASFHGTLADRLDSEIVHTAPKDNVSRQNYEMTIQATPDSLDDCGLRYFLAVRHHTYLLRCLPLAQRAQLQRQGLGPHFLVWAFHSETQEELAQLIPALQKPTLRWSELRELGIGWWVRSNQLLRRIIEKLAKSSFQAKQNPLDAALYYMAMKKKTVLAALFRSVNDKRMSDFFQNDFSQDRWRKAALKNAYVLLGKQQFEYAAAFFLLANAVKDAVQVCLSKLEDLQLAMVVVRLYEGDLDSVPEHLRRLLDAEVLGQPEGAEGPSMELAHPDPFLRSMALWLLQRYEESLTTLLQTRVGQEHHRIHQETQHLSSSAAGQAANASDKASVSGPPAADDTADPGVFNFYLYLRTHPLVVRRNLAKSMSMRRKHGRAVLLSGFKPGSTVSKTLTPGGTTSSDTITPLERRLFFTTSHAHFRAGCPPLALEVLSRLPNCILDDSGNATAEEGSPAKRKDSNGGPPSGAVSNGPVQQKADEFDWSQPLAKAPQKAEDFDWSQPLSTGAATQKADAFDWSQPLSTSAPKNKADDFDWSQPLASTAAPKSDSFDWNEPAQSTPHFENIKGSKQFEEEETLAQNRVETLDIMAQQLKFMACLKIMMEELSTLATGFEVDGGQLRHQLYIWLERCVAALKELCQYGAAMQVSGSSSVSETSILPDAAGEEGPALGRDRANTGTADGAQAGTPVPTLHAILVADKQDFEAKLVRAARRKLWLKANEALLRTLLSYTGLHGAHGGGLAVVRMELNLLLQELQQDRSQQQLLSPLPFPTTLPLLAASVACQKTVVADPVRLLQLMAHDILLTVMDLEEPPGAATSASTFSRVSVLWDLGTSLSACIYQALCDSDSFGLKGQQGSNRGLDVEDCLSLSVVYQNSHLLVGHATRRPRLGSTDEPLSPTTQPSKWPGVQSLRALMARDKDEDGPRLHTLLCESFVAVYLSQLIHALASCDCHVLYRLVGQRFNQRAWSMLFGGGAKKLLRVSAGGSSGAVTPSAAAPEKEATATVETGIFDAITRQRVKWNMKILPQLKSEAPQANVREDRPTYREIFVPPIMSMMSCFMSKPALSDQMAAIDYDSAASLSSDEEDAAGGHDEEIDEDDVFKDTGTTDQQRRPSQGSRLEQLDPGSYAWALMRYAVVKMANHSLRDFLSVAGIELQELPVTSPLLHASLRAMDHWLRHLREALEAHGSAPPGLLPNSHVEAAGQGAAPVQGPPILKYKVLLEVDNTPFSRSKHPAAYPARRLWNYLVRQEGVQDLFIRYLFSHKVAPPLDTQAQAQATKGQTQPPKEGGAATTTPGGEGDDRSIDGGLPDPVRIIHKDQESISAFCISQVNEGILSLATPKELQELDISALLEPAPWLDDEAEFDILAMNRPPEPPAGQALDFLVVQHPLDRHNASVGTGLPIAASSAFTSPTSANPPSLAAQTGRGTTMMKGLNFPGSTNAHFCQIVLERSRLMIKPLKRHRVDSVRRLASHPVLPLYLSGCQDGSVSLWEWGHAQPVSTPRLAGTFAKVTSLLFNQQGNKFGVTDGDGNLSLWQVSMTSTNAKPFFSASCHTKQASDFAFVSSTSLIATAGHSTENRNVCLWDTLLPQRKALVASFSCHEHGSSAVVFAPQNQLLISAGKKGDVFIFDVRQRQLRHKFQAHETAIKCLAMDPREEYYITGSADGDIKVWGLPVHVLLYAFPSEHSRSTLFRNIGMGVTHLLTDAKGRLYSCGADGSMKMRQLPDRDAVVASFT